MINIDFNNVQEYTLKVTYEDGFGPTCNIAANNLADAIFMLINGFDEHIRESIKNIAVCEIKKIYGKSLNPAHDD